MAAKALEEKVVSASELPADQAVAVLRDVVLGSHPNDADSVKAKEQARLFFLPPTGPMAPSQSRRYTGAVS